MSSNLSAGRTSWRTSNPCSIASIVGVVGVAISVGLWSLTSNHENRIRTFEFNQLAIERADAIQREVNDDIELLYSLAAFYNGSDHVDRDEFRVFTQPLFTRRSSLLALEWLPKIPIEGRRDFERRVGYSLDESITISQMGTSRQLETAGMREFYFPVDYLVQREEMQSSVFGFDQSSDPPRWAAMSQAIDLGVPVASERLTLFRIAGTDSERTGMLVAMPVYANSSRLDSVLERQTQLKGLVVGLFRIADVVDRALADLALGGINFHIIDRDADADRKQLHSHSSRAVTQQLGSTHSDKVASSISKLRAEKEIAIAGRSWSIVFNPADAFNAAHQGWTSTTLLITALVSTVMLSTCVFLVLGRTAVVERLVDDRTAELQIANQKLQVEVQDRKDAEYALRISESRIRAILETAVDAIITIDVRGQVHSMNPASEKMFGYSASEVIGRNVSMLMPSPFSHEHDAYLEQYVKTGIKRVIGSGREAAGKRKDGTTFPMELSVSEVEVGQDRMFTGIVRDITEQKRGAADLAAKADELANANDNLAEKNRELDEFNYVVSHDLQEPIRKLISFSEMLKQDMTEELNENAASDLYFIVDAAQRMRLLVLDLLAMSRAGRSAMKCEPFQLEKCVDDVLDVLQLRIEETNATISRDPLPQITGDHTMIRQLYQNLVSNALKFVADRPPMIRLTAERQGGFWILGVKDNGIGLKPEFAERIFKPFQRLHSRSEYSGTGIGLAICKKNVTRHGGKIEVESQPGVGSHFKFTIPVEAADSIQERQGFESAPELTYSETVHAARASS